jgi:hypothetical protein
MKPPRAITGVPDATQIKRVPIAAAPNDALQVFNSGRLTLQRLFEQHEGLARRLNSIERTTAEFARASFRSLIAPPIASLGPYFVDGVVGTFLSNGHLLSQPSAVDTRWLKLAPDNQARIQVPPLRNVDKRPDQAFVKAYGTMAIFTSLKRIVHFYNTRDVLPRCQPHDPGEGTTCWPAPESTTNMNTSKVGRLGLSDAEEDALVLFMQTLTDGVMH